MKRGLFAELWPTVLFGVAVFGLFIAAAVVWAVQAPLSGAIIANGVVSFEGKRRTVQHLEGGIIDEIRVAEGDHVTAGQVLIELDRTEAEARAFELLNRIRTLAGEESRLRAERLGQPLIHFDHRLLAEHSDPEVAATRNQQISLLAARQESHRTGTEILRSRIDQLGQQKQGLQSQLAAVRQNRDLLQEEIDIVATLLKKGLDNRQRLLGLQRLLAEVSADEGEIIASIAEVDAAVGETRMRIANLDSERMEQIDERLAQVQSERVSTEKIYREILFRLSRTTVPAPVDGIVMNLAVDTIGGVVRPGGVLLEIAPSDDQLVIRTKIRPQDVDQVTIGGTAMVMLPAFSQRTTPRISGVVSYVSADAVLREGDAAPYFVATVQINQTDLAALTAAHQYLSAGMPAEVYLETSTRTFADYLLQPLQASFDRAFREG